MESQPGDTYSFRVLPVVTQSRLSATRSFDHLVGTHEEHGWDCHSECACCLQVYSQLEPGWLLDRQVGRLCTAQKPVDEADDMPVTQQISWSIGEQSAILRALGPLVDRWQARSAHPVDNLETGHVQEKASPIH